MQQLIDLYKNSENLHHAYLFVTHEVEETVSKLKNFIEEHLGLKTAGNPDVTHHQFKTLTIDEARALAAASERKTFTDAESLQRKIFIIEADFITEEAQNSLLKVFEEPTVGTHFFIISPQDVFLPTLRSRMQVIQAASSEQQVARKEGSIMELSVPKRLEEVKKITEDIGDEKKTKQDAIAFLNKIERELYDGGVEKNSQSLKICEQARQALYDRGAPVKMILENVVLSV